MDAETTKETIEPHKFTFGLDAQGHWHCLLCGSYNIYVYGGYLVDKWYCLDCGNGSRG